MEMGKALQAGGVGGANKGTRWPKKGIKRLDYILENEF